MNYDLRGLESAAAEILDKHGSCLFTLDGSGTAKWACGIETEEGPSFAVQHQAHLAAALALAVFQHPPETERPRVEDFYDPQGQSEWDRVIFGSERLALCGWKDGTFYQWGTAEQIAECVYQVMKEGHEQATG